MSPNAGGGWELLGLIQWVKLYTGAGAQLNLGDLTPYLIYGGQVFSAQRNLYKPSFSWMGNRPVIFFLSLYSILSGNSVFIFSDRSGEETYTFLRNLTIFMYLPDFYLL